MNTAVLSLAIVNAVSLLAIIALSVGLRRSRHAISDQNTRIDHLQNELNAMCSGVLGFGRQLSDLADKSKKLKQRQDQLEMKEPTHTSYKYALKMARDGADLQDVMADCGIAEGEAELVMLASRMDN